jgi:hypothetical protein
MNAMTWDPRWQSDDYAYLRPLCLAWAEEANLDAARLVEEIYKAVLLGKFDHDGALMSDGRRASGVGIGERAEGFTDTARFQPGKNIERDVENLLAGSNELYVGAVSAAPFLVITRRAVQRHAADNGLSLPYWWSTDVTSCVEIALPEEPTKALKRGRPSVMPLMEGELRRRAGEGFLLPTQIEEMRDLLRWFTKKHPDAQYTPAVKTLTRKLGPLYKALNSAPK